jgi:hypothetical protein
MKKPILILFLLLSAQGLIAQSTNDFLINGGLDLIKTDNDKIFGKAQFGIEVNYFIERHFAVGAGGDFWTQGANSFVLGARWYPSDNIFLRFRGLIGYNDAALGVGYTKPVSKNFRIEGMADLYFKRPDFGLRAGVSYVINYVTRK